MTAKNDESNLEAKPPEFLQKLKWLRIYGWRNRWYVAVAVLFVVATLVIRYLNPSAVFGHQQETSTQPEPTALTEPHSPSAREGEGRSLNVPNDGEATEISTELYGQIFRAGDPYPLGLDRVPLGTPLSVLKKVYPSVRFSPAWSTWSVYPDEGPFRTVRFSTTRSDTSDAEVDWIEFFFRDTSAANEIRSQALTAFGADAAKVANLGEQLEWPDINGVCAALDSVRYSLSLSHEE